MKNPHWEIWTGKPGRGFVTSKKYNGSNSVYYKYALKMHFYLAWQAKKCPNYSATRFPGNTISLIRQACSPGGSHQLLHDMSRPFSTLGVYEMGEGTSKLTMYTVGQLELVNQWTKCVWPSLYLTDLLGPVLLRAPWDPILPDFVPN